MLPSLSFNVSFLTLKHPYHQGGRKFLYSYIRALLPSPNPSPPSSGLLRAQKLSMTNTRFEWWGGGTPITSHHFIEVMVFRPLLWVVQCFLHSHKLSAAFMSLMGEARNLKSYGLPRPAVLNWGNFSPQEHLVVSGNIFYCPSLEWVDAAGIKWVEAWGVAEHPAKTAPLPPPPPNNHPHTLLTVMRLWILPWTSEYDYP